jgi:hypothetical protein
MSFRLRVPHRKPTIDVGRSTPAITGGARVVGGLPSLHARDTTLYRLAIQQHLLRKVLLLALDLVTDRLHDYRGLQ